MAQTRAYLQFFANISGEKQETVCQLLGEKFGINVTLVVGGFECNFSTATCVMHDVEQTGLEAKDLFERIAQSLLELSGVDMAHVKDWKGILDSVTCGHFTAEVL